MPTQLLVGPNAPSGKKTMVLGAASLMAGDYAWIATAVRCAAAHAVEGMRGGMSPAAP
jgi:hypothetical protein